jgi:hypothetical protein
LRLFWRIGRWALGKSPSRTPPPARVAASEAG